MRNSTIILAAGALASAAAIAITGAASATTASKNERFTLVSTSTSPDPAYSVIATGAFADGGTAKKTKAGLALRFPDGTITLDIKKGHKKIVPIVSANACLQTQTSAGTFTVAGGTGAYKGISGSGRTSNSATAVERLVHGACATNYSAAQVIGTATGPVRLH